MKFSTTSAIALVTAVAVANPVPAVEKRDAPWFTITNVVYAGTGCDAGSVSVKDRNDWNAITLEMNGFGAGVGPGHVITDSRKNCQINLSVQYPTGWQYSVVTARYVGKAWLNAGVTGQQLATYYFSGQTNQITRSSTFYGPASGVYDITDVIPTDQLLWSACDGSGVGLNINSELRLNNGNTQASGYISTNFEQIHMLQWRKC